MYLYIIHSYIRVPLVFVARVCIYIYISYVTSRESARRAKWIVCIDLLPLERREPGLEKSDEAFGSAMQRRGDTSRKGGCHRVVYSIVARTLENGARQC